MSDSQTPRQTSVVHTYVVALIGLIGSAFGFFMIRGIESIDNRMEKAEAREILRDKADNEFRADQGVKWAKQDGVNQWTKENIEAARRVLFPDQ